MSPTKPKVDEKRRERQAEAVRKEGLYPATESEDNAVAASDENFVGVEPERKEYAYEVDAPLAGEYEDDDDPEKLTFEAAAKREEEMAARGPVSPRTGFTPNLTHPTERRNPADPFINAQRAALANQAGQPLPGSTTEEKEEAGAEVGGDTEGHPGGGGAEHTEPTEPGQL